MPSALLKTALEALCQPRSSSRVLRLQVPASSFDARLQYGLQAQAISVQTLATNDANVWTALMPAGTFIAYYRVSTARQGRSGLGLEAQKHAVHEYLNGGNWILAQEFLEVESGKRSDRPQLAAALAMCRLHKATLVIAKLDRLARNVAFISSIMESKAEFVACDFPQANRLTVHILAAVAEHEAHAISQRTKAALAAAKARGTVLGGYRGRSGTPADCERARAAQKALADQRARDLAATIEALQAEGHSSLRAIGRELTRKGIPTSRGGGWSSSQVSNTLARIASLAKP